jgi:hypothetical protein
MMDAAEPEQRTQKGLAMPRNVTRVMTAGRSWRIPVASVVIVALSLAVTSSGGAAIPGHAVSNVTGASRAEAGSGETNPSITGMWSIASNLGTTDGLTVTGTGPNTYTFGNDEGYTVADISLPLSSSGGSVDTCWTEEHDVNAQCPVAGEGYFIEDFTFNLATCPATLTGSFEEYTGDGSPAGLSGTYTGKQLSGGQPCSDKSAIAGTVRFVDDHGLPAGRTGVKGASVQVTGPHFEKIAEVNAAGSYRVKVPTAGAYTVVPRVPAAVTHGHKNPVRPAYRHVTVSKNKTAIADFTVKR